MPTLIIDGKTVQMREGAFLLEACRQAGIEVPALCHHAAVEPWGGCRLCVVDVTRSEWEGWKRMVAACLYPVEQGLIVYTKTERVIATRKTILDLLLARCPDTPLVQRLAGEYGITESSWARSPEPTDCVLCGLCTRVCDALGVSAISSSDRGSSRRISSPFNEPPPDCIGCLACAEVCPTRCIPFETSDRRRTIWKKTFEMLRCPDCGRSHITREQADFYAGRGGVPREYFLLCDACKRVRQARTITDLVVST
jgi:NADH dehydrogenase/NADH:ubiquinone oxidoreductase subunit G